MGHYQNLIGGNRLQRIGPAPGIDPSNTEDAIGGFGLSSGTRRDSSDGPKQQGAYAGEFQTHLETSDVTP